MEKINKITLLGQSGQIGSNLKKKIRSIAKNIRCLSKKDLNLEKLSFKNLSVIFHQLLVKN